MMNTDQFRVVVAADCTGAVYTPGGSLLASFVQESVIRSFR